MGADGGTVDAVVTAIRHDLGQRHCHGFPDPGLAPSPKAAIDGVPTAVLRRNVPPWSAATKPPEYAVDDRTVLFWAPPAPPVLRLDG